MALDLGAGEQTGKRGRIDYRKPFDRPKRIDLAPITVSTERMVLGSCGPGPLQSVDFRNRL